MFTSSGSVRTLPAEGLGPNDSGIIGATTLHAVLQLSGSHVAVMSPLFAKRQMGHLMFQFHDDICLFTDAKKLHFVLSDLGSH